MLYKPNLVLIPDVGERLAAHYARWKRLLGNDLRVIRAILDKIIDDRPHTERLVDRRGNGRGLRTVRSSGLGRTLTPWRDWGLEPLREVGERIHGDAHTGGALGLGLFLKERMIHRPERWVMYEAEQGKRYVEQPARGWRRDPEPTSRRTRGTDRRRRGY